MTLPMDIRLAADDARMGFVFTRRGIVPEACSSWFLPRVVGISRAMEWVATGRVFAAQEALDGGLVRSVASARRAARRRTDPRPRDRREHRPRLGRARAPDDVDDARRGAPDARPPRRLAGHALPRTVGRRDRGRDVVPREAPAAIHRPRQRRAARRSCPAGPLRRSNSAVSEPSLQTAPLNVLDGLYLHLDREQDPWSVHLESSVEGHIDATRLGKAVRKAARANPIAGDAARAFLATFRRALTP